MNVNLCPKSLIVKKKLFKKCRTYFRTVQNWVHFANLVSNSKQQNLLDQKLFQNISNVKAVHNIPQNIRKVRQFDICRTNLFMTIQKKVNFVNFLVTLFCSAICLLCYVFYKFL